MLDNLLSPPVLFFALGMFAALVRSDLEIPQPIAKFLSLYLLFAVGFHGGHALHGSGLTVQVGLVLGAAVVMAMVVPAYTFFVLRLRFDVYNSAAIAATYGSVSAVTFVTAGAFLKAAGIPFGGHMVAALALMESPAIVVGVLLLRTFVRSGRDGTFHWKRLIHEACFNGSVLVILGSLIIGYASGDRGWSDVSPFADGIFRGMLSFFLLDLGLVAGRRLGDVRAAGWFLPAFAVGVPLVNAAMGIAIAALLGLGQGDALLFSVLCGSASYIAVPAAMRLAIPEANPSFYVPMALALTFPFNIVLGLPLYLAIIRALWS